MHHGDKAQWRQSENYERANCRQRKKAPMVEENPRQGTERGNRNPDGKWLADVVAGCEEALCAGNDWPG